MTDRRFALAEHLPRDEAVVALRDGRDGARPDAPRLLEVHGSRAPQARARERVRERDPRLPPARRRADREAARARRRRHGRVRRSPTTARSGSTAGSASTSGCGAKGCSRRSPSRTACPRCATSASTGRGRRRGARAATTRASSSTSPAASPRGRSPPEEYEAVRDDLARADRGDPRRRGQADPDGASTSPRSCTASRRASRPTSSSSSAICSGARSGRSAATRAIQTLENDTGPDDANHAQDGLYVVAGPGIEASGRARRAPPRHRADRPRVARDRGAGRNARDEPARAAQTCARTPSSGRGNAIEIERVRRGAARSGSSGST